MLQNISSNWAFVKLWVFLCHLQSYTNINSNSGTAVETENSAGCSAGIFSTRSVNKPGKIFKTAHIFSQARKISSTTDPI